MNKRGKMEYVQVIKDDHGQVKKTIVHYNGAVQPKRVKRRLRASMK